MGYKETVEESDLDDFSSLGISPKTVRIRGVWVRSLQVTDSESWLARMGGAEGELG